jgi:hypothetical protein
MLTSHVEMQLLWIEGSRALCWCRVAEVLPWTRHLSSEHIAQDILTTAATIHLRSG